MGGGAIVGVLVSPGRYRLSLPHGSDPAGPGSASPMVAPFVFVVMKLATWSRYVMGSSLSWINFVAASYGF